MVTWLTTRNTEALISDARALYAEHFDTECAGVWAAPGRVNLIGDHVDYAGGISIPFALEQRTAAAVGVRDDNLLRIVSLAPGAAEVARFEIPLDEVGSGNPANWAGYVAGSVWAYRSDITTGFDIALVSDVPLGSGLSSSAALECSVALAVQELDGAAEDRAALVAACIRAENEVVGASTGGLDQRASLFGQQGHALAIDFAADTVELIPCDLQAAGLTLLIANTNAPHDLSDGQYASRRGLIDAATAALGATTLREVTDAANQARNWAAESGKYDPEVAYRRVAHVVEETARTARAVAALKAGDFKQVRQLMTDSHISLRDGYEVVTPELESAFIAAGQYGVRMTGGGFGGSVIALVPAAEVDNTAKAIAAAAAENGFPEPTFLVALPGAGAQRLDSSE